MNGLIQKVKIGLIVNPLAGIGGRVGLKGSDGDLTQKLAIAKGAVPHSMVRTREALEMLLPYKEQVEIITYPGEMGENIAKELGFEVSVLIRSALGEFSAEDTKKAAVVMCSLQLPIILFAGGDGTARDIYDAVGDNCPVLGIPAGVKIHSAVYAINPAAAGSIAQMIVTKQGLIYFESEVMDLDEEAYRGGKVNTRLYGYLQVPRVDRLVQNTKSPSSKNEFNVVQEIAYEITQSMDHDTLYLVGPGTTTRAIATTLGLSKTLLGVDAIRDLKLLDVDLDEKGLLSLLGKYPSRRIIVTPIGGQGYLFGRGNQQISNEVIRMVGKENVIVIATEHKLFSLQGEPLLVDTGDAVLDAQFTGSIKVITGIGKRMVYPVR